LSVVLDLMGSEWTGLGLSKLDRDHLTFIYRAPLAEFDRARFVTRLAASR
jgi:hypothetical protein